MKTHVTCARYLDFLNQLAKTNPDEAGGLVPRRADKTLEWRQLDSGQWEIPAVDREGDEIDPLWPAYLVSFDIARSFSRWQGRNFHLPGGYEWQKAARGVDGRYFPWGYVFDPTFCRMRQSRPGRVFPARAGTYPADCSPYLVLDCGGNISDLTMDDAGKPVIRGGNNGMLEPACRCARAGVVAETNLRSFDLGFRLCKTLSRETGRLIPRSCESL